MLLYISVSESIYLSVYLYMDVFVTVCISVVSVWCMYRETDLSRRRCMVDNWEDGAIRMIGQVEDLLNMHNFLYVV